ncbi:DUF2512 family protein [Brevibacillus fulvus]|uniref:ABC-type Mn2+/Zn2+ transport system permease subunit n=1 Tax=Brevibacillus fulvus TaxID=1125967 RepID=A0A938Y152_9BACL|nr:DUF2512 family protein [Brevibacillus fulvus]MBM7591410.1 ABC-type Mn2+/Zn2+ transport system permease subunit [Brevibacillus fulvus]
MSKFLIKVLFNGIILVPFLIWFTEAGWLSSIVTSIGLSIIAYLIGDQLILRKTNNVVATIADAVLAAVYLWVVAAYMDWSLSFGELLFTVIVLGVVEFVFHRYLGVLDKDMKQHP